MSRSASLTLKLSLLLLATGALSTVRADTTLDFDSVPAGVTNAADVSPSPIPTNFGSAASASSAGITVTGAGTPNIDLTWGRDPNGGNPVEWDYYVDEAPANRWQAVQMLNSAFQNGGATTIPHTLTFTPNSGAAVSLESLNMICYYVDTPAENFTYHWQVIDANTTAVLGQGDFSFNDQIAKFPVTLDVTGQPDEILTLEMFRTASSVDGGLSPTQNNIAMDDLKFEQSPEPGVLSLLAVGVVGLAFRRRSAKA